MESQNSKSTENCKFERPHVVKTPTMYVYRQNVSSNVAVSAHFKMTCHTNPRKSRAFWVYFLKTVKAKKVSRASLIIFLLLCCPELYALISSHKLCNLRAKLLEHVQWLCNTKRKDTTTNKVRRNRVRLRLCIAMIPQYFRCLATYDSSRKLCPRICWSKIQIMHGTLRCHLQANFWASGELCNKMMNVHKLNNRSTNLCGSFKFLFSRIVLISPPIDGNLLEHNQQFMQLRILLTLPCYFSE